MDNPDVLREIALLLDFDTIVRLGRDTDNTLEVTRLLRDATLWKQKTEMLLDKSLPYDPEANWIVTYQVVVRFLEDLKRAVDQRHIVPMGTIEDTNKIRYIGNIPIISSPIYERGLVDVNTLRILFSVLPPGPLGKYPSSLDQIKLKNLDVFLWLLERGYIENEDAILRVLTSTTLTDAVDLARYITSIILLPEHIQKDIIFGCIQRGSLQVLLAMLEQFPGKLSDSLREIVRYNRLGMLKIVLDKYVGRLTQEDLEYIADYLERFASVAWVSESLKLVLDRLE